MCNLVVSYTQWHFIIAVGQVIVMMQACPHVVPGDHVVITPGELWASFPLHLVIWPNKQNNRRQGNRQIFLKATNSWWDPWFHASSKNNIKASNTNWSERTDFDFKEKLLNFQWHVTQLRKKQNLELAK